MPEGIPFCIEDFRSPFSFFRLFTFQHFPNYFLFFIFNIKNRTIFSISRHDGRPPAEDLELVQTLLHDVADQRHPNKQKFINIIGNQI